MLDGPERVEPDLVAEHRLLERVLVGLVLACSASTGFAHRDLVEQRELHLDGRPPALDHENAFQRSIRQRAGRLDGEGRAGHRRGVGARRGDVRPVCEDEGATVVGARPARRREHPVDVTDEARGRAHASTAIVAEHGRLDVVVNVRGRRRRRARAHARRRRVGPGASRVNLTGTFLSCKHALRPMIEQRSGSIVTVASVEGHRGHRGRQRLQRVEGRRRAAHEEHGDRLRPPRASASTASAPASSTRRCSARSWASEHMAQYRDEYREHHKLGRFGRPEEIAAAAAVPRVRRRVVRHRPRARRRRRLHRRDADRALEPHGARLTDPYR